MKAVSIFARRATFTTFKIRFVNSAIHHVFRALVVDLVNAYRVQLGLSYNIQNKILKLVLAL